MRYTVQPSTQPTVYSLWWVLDPKRIVNNRVIITTHNREVFTRHHRVNVYHP